MSGLLLTFLVLLCTVSVQGLSTAIQFTDEYMFEDIATNNFAIGLNQTYEFLVTARQGKQVSFYFCTAMRNSVVVTVYDGKDKNATTVDIREIFYADSLFANSSMEAPFVSSTNGSLFITVQVYTGPLSKKIKDFQGMVTDVQNPAECGSLLLSNGAVNTWYPTVTTSNGSSCLKILRSTDHNYSPMLATYLTLASTDGVQIYKGLTMNDQHKILGYVAPPDLFIADKYVILSMPKPINLTFAYQWKVMEIYTPMTLQPGQTGSIMTEDFLPKYSSLVKGDYYQQQFTVELMATGSDITGLKLELLAPADAVSNVTIEYYNYNDPVSSRTYTNGQLPTTIEQCGKKVVIAYETTIGQGQGLYAKYSKGGLNCPTGTAETGFFNLALVFTLMLLVMS